MSEKAKKVIIGMISGGTTGIIIPSCIIETYSEA